ncbi:MAG: DUF4388 domain-containing protein [Deltaproteobacteria bacterium]|nr:DUF4388 domain-containing protein [Deltaproteobacteria bacterium]
MKFGQKLIRAGIIDEAQLDAALSHQAETGQRLGEALLELGYIGEDVLLKQLAKEFNTRFVSSASLGKIKVKPELLQIVPQKLAEEHDLFPIILDRDKDLIAVVTCEPQNTAAVEEMKIISGVSKVLVYIALREPIRAAIRKHYKGDIISSSEGTFRPKPRAPRLADPSLLTPVEDEEAYEEPDQGSDQEPYKPYGEPDEEPDEEPAEDLEPHVGSGDASLEDEITPPEERAPPDKRIQDMAPPAMVEVEDLSAEHEMEYIDPARPASSGPVVIKEEGKPITSSWTRQIEEVRKGSLVSDNDFIETLNILVGLLEMQRSNLQGHSARLAKYVKVISERMGQSETNTNHFIIAAYLHDLGKRASVHLTLLSISRSEDHRNRARRYHLTPARLFDSVHLPAQVNQIIGHLYENYDGTGLPEQLSGESIPLGARIIAVVDAYEDLISNTTNPFGMLLQPEDALAKLQDQAEKLFDPNAVSMLVEIIHKETAEEQLTSSSPMVLVADADNSSTSVIELKLVKRGFQVRVARDSYAAMESLRYEPVAAVLAEMHLEPKDAFGLMDFVKELGRAIPFFMTSNDTSPEAITRAFDLGVADFFNKPFVPAVVIAKIQKELAGKPVQTEPPISGYTDEESGVVIEVESDGKPPPDDGAPREYSEEDFQASPPPEQMDLSSSMPEPPTGTMAGVVSTNAQILSGSLEDKSALALIKALSGRRRSGLLSLRDGERKGTIFFEKGHVFQASLGEIQDEEAFLELAAWRDCLYKFEPQDTPRARYIKTGTGKLIRIASMSEES